MMRTLLAVALLVSFVVCFRVPYAARQPPPEWSALELGVDQPVTLTFAIKQRNLDLLQNMFEKISDPRSPLFRQFFTQDQLRSLIKPEQSIIDTLTLWLEDHGIYPSQIELNPSEDFIIVRRVPTKIASKLLDCQFVTYRHERSKRLTQACSSYSLPSHIAQNVDFVGGVAYFPKTSRDTRIPLAPRVSSNAPYIAKASPGDENFGLFILPFCSDGTPSTNPSLSCSQGPSISGFQVSVRQFYAPQTLNVPTSAVYCANCSSWPAALQDTCQQTNSELGLGASTMYCQTLPFTTLNLKNYVQVNLSLTTTFADGSLSDTTNYGTPFFLGEFVTPQTLLNYYGISAEQAVCKNVLNTQSVAEFLGEFYSPSDLLSFFQYNGIHYPGYVELVGPNNITDPGTEASLDIEFLMGIAQNVTTYFWSLGNLHDGQEPFLEWITQVLNSAHPPFVHSISYGDDENTLTVEYMNRVNTEFMKAGSVGLTLLFSSGDNGVNSGYGYNCIDEGQFVPSFPASSPYVTAVGGTQFSTQTETVCGLWTEFGNPIVCNALGEISASIKTGARITSGGGFSNVFSMPPYQTQVVQQYLSGIDTPTSYFNVTGRAYPDISACARNFLVVRAGTIHPTDGTSAAAPTAAAMMTIINDGLVGKSQPLGFINPTVYLMGKENFFDITQGDNSCGEDITNCCPYGFVTKPGWDAVTGFGTINFPNFMKAIVQPPPPKKD